MPSASSARRSPSPAPAKRCRAAARSRSSWRAKASGARRPSRRKLRELLFAAQLEHHFTKDEILALYLNKVYFGNGLYGAEAAARGYFGKKASEVSLGEASLLAGLLKAPSNYDPSHAPHKAEARQTVVLKAMLESKAITREEYDRAFKTQIEIYDGLRAEEPYGQYFKDEVRRQLVERFGLERVEQGGLKVYTTIDPYMQRAADAAVEQSLAEIEKSLPKQKTARDPLQGALVAIDPESGAVRAMVGGRDFRASNFNRATRAKRQPGSAFKPFIYAAAVESGFGPEDVITDLDEPLEVSNAVWTPDDEHVDEGELTLREGLRLSSNRAAVHLLSAVGLRQTMKQAKGFGFDDLPAVPSVALGSGEVTLSAITAAYGAFANNGAIFAPHLVRRVRRSRRPVALRERDCAATRDSSDHRLLDGGHAARRDRRRHRLRRAADGILAARRRQDRHDERLPRCVVHRLYAVARRPASGSATTSRKRSAVTATPRSSRCRCGRAS